MNPLLLLGWIGLPAYVAGGSLTSMTLKDPNLAPKIGGFDARAVVGGVGVVIATLLTGPLGLVGAGSAIGALLSFDDTRKVKQGLSMQAMGLAQQQAQIPMMPGPAALPGPAAVPPLTMTSPAAPVQEPGWWDRLFN